MNCLLAHSTRSARSTRPAYSTCPTPPPFVTPSLTRFARSFEAGATSSVSELTGDRGTAVGTAGGTVNLVGGKATSSNANLTENQGRGVTAGETAIVGGSAHGESVSDVGGRVEVRAGAADVGRGGDVVVLAGAGNTSSSGTVRFESADAGNNGTSGDVTVSTGAGASAGQGKVDASNTTNNAHLDAGSVLLASGAALQGRSGDVVLVRFIELLPACSQPYPYIPASTLHAHQCNPTPKLKTFKKAYRPTMFGPTRTPDALNPERVRSLAVCPLLHARATALPPPSMLPNCSIHSTCSRAYLLLLPCVLAPLAPLARTLLPPFPSPLPTRSTCSAGCAFLTRSARRLVASAPAKALRGVWKLPRAAPRRPLGAPRGGRWSFPPVWGGVLLHRDRGACS
jgi:hypothetical protein